MPEDRGKRPAFLTCKHCGSELESQADIIKRALKRLEMYPERNKDGKKRKI